MKRRRHTWEGGRGGRTGFERACYREPRAREPRASWCCACPFLLLPARPCTLGKAQSSLPPPLHPPLGHQAPAAAWRRSTTAPPPPPPPRQRRRRRRRAAHCATAPRPWAATWLRLVEYGAQSVAAGQRRGKGDGWCTARKGGGGGRELLAVPVCRPRPHAPFFRSCDRQEATEGAKPDRGHLMGRCLAAGWLPSPGYLV